MFTPPLLSASLRLTSTDLTIVTVNLKKNLILKLYQQPLDSGIITATSVNINRLTQALFQALKATRLRQPVVLGFPDHDRQFALLNSLLSATTATRITVAGFEPTSLTLSKLAPVPGAVVMEIRQTQSTATAATTSGKIAPLIITHPGDIVTSLKSLSPQQLFVCGEGSTLEWQQFLSRELDLPVKEALLPPLTNLPPFPARFAVPLSLACHPPVKLVDTPLL